MRAAISLSRFDLVTLRLFVATARDGSLTRGAERANLSLPAASKRIAELEAHVGSTLLVRSKKGVVPTPAGQTLLRHAVEVVASLEQLSMAMADFHDGAGGHLRLWANTSAFTGFLPRLLARYAAAHPHVVLDLEDAWSDDTVGAVVQGAAELGIVGDNVSLQGLQCTLCDVDELVLLVPYGHPLAGDGMVSVADVLAFDLVGLHRATSITRQVAEAAEVAGRPMKMRVQVRGFDEMCRMIGAGLGVGLLPRACVSPLVRSLGLRVQRLTGMRTERRLLLVFRRRESLSPPAEAFVRMAHEQLEQQQQQASAELPGPRGPDGGAWRPARRSSAGPASTLATTAPTASVS